MNIKQKFFVVVLSLPAISLPAFVPENITANAPDAVIAASVAVATLAKDSLVQRKITAEVKVLKHSSMKLLNMMLETRPEGTLRMSMASSIIKKVQKTIAQKYPQDVFVGSLAEEKAFVHAQLETILKPVKPFFEVIQDPAVVNIVIPLIEESLGDLAAGSYLFKYCSSKKDIMAFCDAEIAKVETLSILCSELLHFFSSISMSLSDGAKKALEDLRKELQKMKQTGQMS